LVSIVLDGDLYQRVRAEAGRQGKSVSRFVRDVLAERLRRRPARNASGSALMKLCGLARGELARADIDDELYGA
jgi:hypothetical protein